MHVFQYSLPVLKIYSAHNVCYRFSALNIEMQSVLFPLYNCKQARCFNKTYSISLRLIPGLQGACATMYTKGLQTIVIGFTRRLFSGYRLRGVLPNLFGITSGSVSTVCWEFCKGYCWGGNSLSSAGFSCRGFATRSRRTRTTTTRMMSTRVTKAPTTTPINGDNTIPASWPATTRKGDSFCCVSSSIKDRLKPICLLSCFID